MLTNRARKRMLPPPPSPLLSWSEACESSLNCLKGLSAPRRNHEHIEKTKGVRLVEGVVVASGVKLRPPHLDVQSTTSGQIVIRGMRTGGKRKNKGRRFGRRLQASGRTIALSSYHLSCCSLRCVHPTPYISKPRLPVCVAANLPPGGRVKGFGPVWRATWAPSENFDFTSAPFAFERRWVVMRV